MYNTEDRMLPLYSLPAIFLRMLYGGINTQFSAERKGIRGVIEHIKWSVTKQ